MQRPTVTVEVRDESGGIVETGETRAFNSGIRKSEAIVRELARAAGEMFAGDHPGRVGNVYTRTWTGCQSGRTLVTTVSLAPAATP